MKATLNILLCAAFIVAASAAAKPAATAKPVAAKPAAKPASVVPLVLTDGKLIVVQPAKNADARPGTPAIYRTEIQCAGEQAVIGDCSWTGTYLTNEGEGLVNYIVTCVFDEPCGPYKPGSITVVGRAKGVDSTSYVELPIVGGTGPYAYARGIYSWKEGINTFRLSRK